jgi:site-specific DNA recombinase
MGELRVMDNPKPPKIDVDAILAQLGVPQVRDADFAGYALVYVRVSTADQGERYSPASQMKAILQKAASLGYRVKREHIFVDTHTGKLISRPGFDRMKAAVKRGTEGVKGAVIFCMDRLARKVLDALFLKVDFKKHGVDLHFCDMTFENTPVGRFTFTQQAAIAELIGEKIVEDSARGRRQALEQGLLVHGSAKYGYIYLDKRQPGGQHFVIDEERAKVVRDVFRWSLQGMSMHAIARKLNEDGILSKGSPRFPPGKWSMQTVKQMLTSPTYTGRHTCSGIEVPCPRIIDDATWTAVNAGLTEKNAKYVGRPSKNQYLLRSFLWCGKCGKRCITSPNHGYPFYRCGNIERRHYARRCDADGVRTSVIEREVWEMVWNLLDGRRLLEQARAYYDAMRKPDAATTGARLRKEATRLRTEETNILKMTKAGMYTVAQGQKEQQAIWEQLRQIDAQLAACNTVVEMPSLQQAEAAVRRIRGGCEPSTYQRRRNILEGIIELRMTYYEGDLTISGKIPMRTEPAQADTFGGKTAKKNWNSRQGDYSNSFAPVPFELTRRIV